MIKNYVRLCSQVKCRTKALVVFREWKWYNYQWLFFCCDKTQFDRYQVTFLIKKVKLQHSTTPQKHNFLLNLFWWLYLSRQKYCRNMFILLLGLLLLNDTLRAKCTYSYTGYLSSLLSSLFCDVLSNNINNIEKLHQRIFSFFRNVCSC